MSSHHQNSDSASLSNNSSHLIQKSIEAADFQFIDLLKSKLSLFINLHKSQKNSFSASQDRDSVSVDAPENLIISTGSYFKILNLMFGDDSDEIEDYCFNHIVCLVEEELNYSQSVLLPTYEALLNRCENFFVVIGKEEEGLTNISPTSSKFQSSNMILLPRSSFEKISSQIGESSIIDLSDFINLAIYVIGSQEEEKKRKQFLEMLKMNARNTGEDLGKEEMVAGNFVDYRENERIGKGDISILEKFVDNALAKEKGQKEEIILKSDVDTTNDDIAKKINFISYGTRTNLKTNNDRNNNKNTDKSNISENLNRNKTMSFRSSLGNEIMFNMNSPLCFTKLKFNKQKNNKENKETSSNVKRYSLRNYGLSYRTREAGKVSQLKNNTFSKDSPIKKMLGNNKRYGSVADAYNRSLRENDDSKSNYESFSEEEGLNPSKVTTTKRKFGNNARERLDTIISVDDITKSNRNSMRMESIKKTLNNSNRNEFYQLKGPDNAPRILHHKIIEEIRQAKSTGKLSNKKSVSFIDEKGKVSVVYVVEGEGGLNLGPNNCLMKVRTNSGKETYVNKKTFEDKISSAKDKEKDLFTCTDYLGKDRIIVYHTDYFTENWSRIFEGNSSKINSGKRNNRLFFIKLATIEYK